ncbi:MAG: hypothetical protein JXQ87_12150 [Bacteroidia bacterium]
MRATILSIILLIPLFSFAQENNKLDSLWGIWENEQNPDTLRAEGLYSYIVEYKNTDFDTSKAINLASRLLKYSNERNNFKGLAYSYSIKAGNISYTRQFDSIIIYRRKALKYARKANFLSHEAYQLKQIAWCNLERTQLDSVEHWLLNSIQIYKNLAKEDKQLLGAYEFLGIYYGYKGQLMDVIITQNHVAELAIKLKNYNKATYAFTAIARAYYEANDLKNADTYFNKAREFAEKSGEDEAKFRVYSTIIGNYISQDSFHLIGNHIDDLLGLDIVKSQAGFREIGQMFFGAYLISKEQYDSAITVFQKIIPVFERLQFRQGVAGGYYYQAVAFNKKGLYSKAVDFCKIAYDISVDMGLLKEHAMSCRCLSDNYKAIGNYKESMMYYIEFRNTEDTIAANGTSKDLLRFEFKQKAIKDSLNNVQKELELNLAHEREISKEKRDKNLLLSGGILLLLIAGGTATRLNYIRKSKKLIEKEKHRSDELLLNILPAEVAEELKVTGESEAQHFDQVSILFTDFKEFTQTAEKLSAKELVNEINTCFKAFDNICEKYGIEKIKTIGDSYMAAIGLKSDVKGPKSTSDVGHETRDIVQAALEMQEFMNTQKFEMRAGIHTGPVVAGIVGVKKFQYDIWGDTVNTASRMESHGEVGKVNISNTTYLLLKSHSNFRFEAREELDIKGKGLMKTWFVQGLA